MNNFFNKIHLGFQLSIMRLYIKLFHKNVFLFIRFSLMFSLKVSVTLIFLVYSTIIFSFFLSLFIMFFRGFSNALFACFRTARCDLISVTILIVRCLKLSDACLQRFKSFNFGFERCCADGARARFVENLFLARAFHFSFPKKPKSEDREE